VNDFVEDLGGDTMNAMINGINLAFDDVGQGPAVIMVHDLPLCRKMWKPQVTMLVENGFRVIAPDLRGFGESEAGYRPFSLKNCADDIVSLLHYLGIGRAVMVGMGMAGGLIRDIERRHPRRVAAICLLSPSQALAGISNEILRQDLAGLIREGHRLTAIDNLCSRLFPEQQSLLTQQLAWEVQNWIEDVDPSVLAAAFACDSDFTSTGSSVPSLTLHSERSIKTGPSGEGQVSDVILDKVLSAGHLVNLESPERVNRCLIDFLNWLSLMKPRHHRLAIAA
jgi:pimeloyl-ACP methyl ester carboxylesterase